MNKVIIITGASSGIGFDSAMTLARQGHTVYAAARRTNLMEPLKQYGVKVLEMDVTREDTIQACVDTVMENEGRIDVVVNNAGYGYFGAIETVSMEEARRQVEVNVFGLASLSKKVLPIMRAQHSGRIVNIASVAGRLCLAYGGWYHVSKYAVEAFSDALRIEAKPFGIDVVLIEPGAIHTDWGIIAADHLVESSKGTVYEESASREAKLMYYAYRSKLFSGPSAVTKCISRAVNSRRPRCRYNPGRGAGMLLFWHAILPARAWDALNRMAVKMK